MSGKNVIHDEGVVKALDDQWFKICALLMYKLGVDEVQIDTELVETFVGRNLTVVMDARSNDGNILTVKLLPHDEAIAHARAVGSLKD